jgi:hypothetical protein
MMATAPKNKTLELIQALADANYNAGEWTLDADEPYSEVEKQVEDATSALAPRILELETDESRMDRLDTLTADQMQTLVDHKRKNPDITWRKLLDFAEGMP